MGSCRGGKSLEMPQTEPGRARLGTRRGGQSHRPRAAGDSSASAGISRAGAAGIPGIILVYAHLVGQPAGGVTRIQAPFPNPPSLLSRTRTLRCPSAANAGSTRPALGQPPAPGEGSQDLAGTGQGLDGSCFASWRQVLSPP